MPEVKLSDDYIAPEIEKGLLLTCSKDKEVFYEIEDFLSEDVFALKETKEIFKALVANQEYDLLDWPELTVTPLEAAQSLQELYQKRMAADLIQRSCHELSHLPIDEVLDHLDSGLSTIQTSTRQLRAGQLIMAHSLLKDILLEIKLKEEAKKSNPNGIVGIPTPIKRLNALLGGFQTGIHLLAAEPGLGKTTFALQIAGHVTSERIPVIFVSFEESIKQLYIKAVCQKSGLELKKFSSDEFKRGALEYAQSLDHLYFIEGQSTLTVNKLKAKACRAMAETNSNRCLIIVDYLQKWAYRRKSTTDFRHTIADLTGELSELALRLEIPILAICSQNRAGYNTSKKASLKESGTLEYDADSIMFLTQNEKTISSDDSPTRSINLDLNKNRYGNVDPKIKLIFKPNYGSIREAAW